MSYPPYQQDGSQPPYRTGGGMPYPSYGAPYPPPQGVFPPSLGMPMSTPMYMPQPYGGMPPAPYPSPYGGGAPGYPPAGGGAPGYAGYGDAHPHPPPPQHSESSYRAPVGGVPCYPGVGVGGGGGGGGHDVHTPAEIKYTPTVFPANPFDPRGDAEILRKAMKGFGTDEKAIINVLGRRTNSQRLDIALQFKTLYGKDLVKDLKSETSGKFEDLLVALMTPLPVFYAKEIHHAISGMGTDEETLIEIMCSMDNNEIRCITAAYQAAYYRSLEDDLRGDTSGTFKRLLTSLCTAGRDENPQVNHAQATADAQSLLQAGELRWGTDESTFNMVMCQRSYAHLRVVFDEYTRICGRDIEDSIKSEFSGNSEDGMLAIVRCVRNRPGFYAKMLHASVRGAGTNDRQLIRIISTRCEVDLADIKTNYQAKYGESLKDAITGDTSGDYKKLLLCLIGEY